MTNNTKKARRDDRQNTMDELLSLQDQEPSPKEEIAFLLAMAILRKHRRSRNKEPDLLDNSGTSCLTVDTPSENDRGRL